MPPTAWVTAPVRLHGLGSRRLAVPTTTSTPSPIMVNVVAVDPSAGATTASTTSSSATLAAVTRAHVGSLRSPATLPASAAATSNGHTSRPTHRSRHVACVKARSRAVAVRTSHARPLTTAVPTTASRIRSRTASDGDRYADQGRDDSGGGYRQEVGDTEPRGRKRRPGHHDHFGSGQGRDRGPRVDPYGDRARRTGRDEDRAREHKQAARGQVTEPAGVVGPEHVEREQTVGHHGQRLRGAAQPAPCHPGGEHSGNAGETDQGRGAPADPHRRPRHHEEHECSDQQAACPECEQQLGH